MAGLPSSILRLFPPLVALLEEPDLRRLVIAAGAPAWLETSRSARATGVRVEADELEAAVQVLAEKAGKVFDEAHPWFEAVLRDGSRFVGVRAPVASRLTLVVERPARVVAAEVPAAAAFAALRGANVIFTGLGDDALAGLGRVLGGARVVEVSRPPATLPPAIHLVPQPGTDGPGLGDCLRLAGRMAAERALVPGLRTVQAWDLVATAATRPVPIGLSLAAHDAGGALARLEAMARQGAGPRADAVPGLIRAAFDRVVTIGPVEPGGPPAVRAIAALVGDAGHPRLEVLWSSATSAAPPTGVTRLVVRRAVRLASPAGADAALAAAAPSPPPASVPVAGAEDDDLQPTRIARVPDDALGEVATGAASRASEVHALQATVHAPFRGGEVHSGGGAVAEGEVVAAEQAVGEDAVEGAAGAARAAAKAADAEHQAARAEDAAPAHADLEIQEDEASAGAAAAGDAGGAAEVGTLGLAPAIAGEGLGAAVEVQAVEGEAWGADDEGLGAAERAELGAVHASERAPVTGPVGADAADTMGVAAISAAAAAAQPEPVLEAEACGDHAAVRGAAADPDVAGGDGDGDAADRDGAVARRDWAAADLNGAAPDRDRAAPDRDGAGAALDGARAALDGAGAALDGAGPGDHRGWAERASAGARDGSPELGGAAALDPTPPGRAGGADPGAGAGSGGAGAGWEVAAAPEAGDLDPRAAGIELDFREAVDATLLASLATPVSVEGSAGAGAADTPTREIDVSVLLQGARLGAEPGFQAGSSPAAPGPQAAGPVPAPVVARPVGRPLPGAPAPGPPRPAWDRRLTPRPVAQARPSGGVFEAPVATPTGRPAVATADLSEAPAARATVETPVETSALAGAGGPGAQGGAASVAAPHPAPASEPVPLRWGLDPDGHDEPGTVEVDLYSDSGLRPVPSPEVDGASGPSWGGAVAPAAAARALEPEAVAVSPDAGAWDAASAPDAAWAPVAGHGPAPQADAWAVADAGPDAAPALAAQAVTADSPDAEAAAFGPAAVWTLGAEVHPESAPTAALPLVAAGAAQSGDVGGTSELAAIPEASVSLAGLSVEDDEPSAGVTGDAAQDEDLAAGVSDLGPFAVASPGAEARPAAGPLADLLADLLSAPVDDAAADSVGDSGAERAADAQASPRVPPALDAAEFANLVDGDPLHAERAGAPGDDAPDDGAPEEDAPEEDAPEEDAPEEDTPDASALEKPPMVSLGSPVLDGPLQALLRSLGADDASSLDDEDEDDSTTMITELSAALGVGAAGRGVEGAVTAAGGGAERRSFSQILRSISGVHPERLSADDPVPGRGRHTLTGAPSSADPEAPEADSAPPEHRPLRLRRETQIHDERDEE